MEEGSEVCNCLPFLYCITRRKTARTDQNPNNFHIAFEFQVLKFSDFGDGDTDAVELEFYHRKDWVCSQFISSEGCQSITDHLKQSGICSNCIDRMLEETISEAMLAMSDSKESKSQHDQELLSLCIYRYVSWEAAINRLTSTEVNNQVPATKESIEALKKVKLDDGVSGSVETCVICLENLWQETTMEVTSLPCSHLFHGNCIVEWLNRSHLCPLCRHEMPTSP